ncbi:MAG: vitamin K epoxide reductase family protein [Chloroflexi bacterium]|nr:vitamin K epoxide reductase family protein [Chloroflexota bacterium]
MTSKHSRQRPVAPWPATQESSASGLWIIAVLTLVGLGLSAYLTTLHYSASLALFCSTGSSCDIVQHSKYATLFGVPVALAGAIGFSAMLLTLLWAWKRPERWPLLYALAFVGFVFSAYLTVVELFVIKEVCPYCVAVFAIAAAVLILAHPRVPRAWLVSLRGGLVTLAVAAIVLGVAIGAHQTKNATQGTESYRVALAKHLTESGAVMYGAYWCPHCADQKSMFGDAIRYVTYVECDPRGEKPNPALCNQKGVYLYPTWEVGGRMYTGVMSLEQLALLTGYTPPL